MPNLACHLVHRPREVDGVGNVQAALCLWLTILASMVLATTALANTAQAADPVDYLHQVKPLLQKRCFACHGALKQESGLRLDSAANIRQGGDSGPAIESGDAAASLLLNRISDPDAATRMPPEGEPLSAEQIAVLKAWIEEGAQAPAEERPEEDAREHWAFRPVERPAIPQVEERSWIKNPIDAFVAAQHTQHGLKASPAASPHALLRRVYLDLIGLPPTAEELQAFLADPAPDAYERVVERLLANPKYGERWGRHWMDVWRYSDWYGRRAVPDVMNSYPQIWRWRDWIVRAMNEDKGYDRMILEMLAADEIAPDDDQQLPATGFMVRNWYKWNYETWMKDQVEHTGKAFLGLTLNCAHCHDHKYDPITQEEYFKFRAFFEPLELRHDRVPGLPDPGPFVKYVYAVSYGPIEHGMIRVFDEKLDAQTFMYSGGDARNRIAGRPPVSAGVPASLAGEPLVIEPVPLPPTAYYPGLKPFVQHEEIARRRAAIAAAESVLASAQAASQESLPALDAQVQDAETALAALAAPAPAALAGTQSLVLDATVGRRVLANGLDDLNGVDNRSVVSFRLLLADDGHTNLQLALDIDQGATGGFVTFDGGRIVSYRPGGFERFDVGGYNFEAGQNRFDVRLALDVDHNCADLTVISLSDAQALVEGVRVALNGWNAVGGDPAGIFLDARPGTVAVYDSIQISRGGASPILFDFEPPPYAAGQDVVGIGGWRAPSFSEAPAVSLVATSIDSAEARLAALRLHSARRKREAALLAIEAAEAALGAARADLTSFEARLAADLARHVEHPADESVRIEQAVQAERQAVVARALVELKLSQRALAEAEVRPPDDAMRATEVDAAGKKSAAAQAALDLAQAALSEPAGEYPPLSPTYPQQSTGRRTALAKWIASEHNPLTARVAVNHIWLRHFGRALVETTANFGRSGKRPTHPELLDWLAAELTDHGWSTKHIHRLLVTSSAYRMQSGIGSAANPNQAADPDNLWLWHFNPRRMEAEVVRDSVLAVAGQLDSTIGGKEIEHELGLTSRRRSIYFSHHGESKMELMELFDAANPCDCYQRTTSVMPQQALALTNSELARAQARLLARNLWQAIEGQTTDGQATGGDDAQTRFVRTAFEQVLCRGPSDKELALSREFLARQRALLTAAEPAQVAAAAAVGAVPALTVPAAIEPASRARENLIHALFSHNDFVTIR